MISSAFSDSSLKPANNQTMLNAEIKTTNNQKGTPTILTGSENQALNFQKFNQNNSESGDFYLAKSERSSKCLKIDPAWELNKFANRFDGHLEEFNSILLQLDKASTTKQTGLCKKFKTQSNEFRKDKMDVLRCFENAKDKLDKLNHKINDGFGHSTNATEKDTQSRLEKRNKLEAALKKTLLKFYDAENLEDYVMLSLMAVPANAKETLLTLSKVSKYIETSMHILDQLDVKTFYVDELADKRDLTNFYGILENCQQDLNEMPFFEEQLERINKEFSFHQSPGKSKDNFSMPIEEAITNISLKIKDLNMPISDNLGDNEFGKLLESRQQRALTRLETLQNEIMTNYHSCCMELNKVIPASS